jgi:hypothetical protein
MFYFTLTMAGLLAWSIFASDSEACGGRRARLVGASCGNAACEAPVGRAFRMRHVVRERHVFRGHGFGAGGCQ